MLTERIIGALTFRRGVYAEVEAAKPVFDRQIATSSNLLSVIPGIFFARSWAAHLNNRAKEHPAQREL